ncbi:MAG TPA: serine/threonine-protein kinase [Thermoanaerobaculia bacterium]|nr:serine/threonine-protein kinase [Thermoanaerobaculia bacterium]
MTQFQRTYASRLIDGKYQILDRLGVGGMGEIFKVRHIHLNELRVIKIMRPNVASDDQGLQRFLQEARTSTMIKHKNLAMLYDFAQLDDGSYYMVWEFIDGTNIQKWIFQNGPMPARLTVEIAIQALSGLDHLHSMGLIHRDISPENIMLSQDHHGKLLVKVIDFGIAKQLAEGEGGQGLTQTGMFLGKLKYASPEQAGYLKEGEHLDPRSDLYSFGIVMYEMLAGRAPFQATNPHGYILKHVTEKPVPIHELVPEVTVPPQLESIVQKSLEKNRNQRFATAAEFADALGAVRESIAPDAKYGLGERMVTLSNQRTVQDLPKPRTGQQPTMGAAPTQVTTGATGARTQADTATVIERGPTLSQQPTVIERSASGAPTVQERLASQAAPTAVESKWQGDAQPTVLERQAAPKKNKAAMLSVAAAAVVIAVVAAIMLTRPKPPIHVDNNPKGSTGSISVNANNTTGTSPVSADKGALLLSANPWGDIEKIINENSKQPVDLSAEKTSTPTRIDLAPGKYSITMVGPNGKATFDVQIDAGKKIPKAVDLGGVNYDELEKDITKQ